MNAPSTPRADQDRPLFEDPLKPWVVVESHAGKETFAKFHLQKQGFEVYLPMRLTRGRDGRGGVKPFFPRYQFVTVGPDVRRWQSIFSTLGVKRVFCTGERPIGVRNEFIESIRAQEVEGLLSVGVGLTVPCPYSNGDKVLMGAVEAVFLERVDDRRAQILVQLLGRESRVTVDLTKLDASEPGVPVRFTSQHRRSA